ncbi:MAG: tetratricopeptide repeat protein [Pirellulales bacterium]|nr:tetratricopeptide repeat protein [Pirellulales bacterium]
MRLTQPPAVLIVAAALWAGKTAPAEEPIDLDFEQAKQAIEDGEYDVALALMDKAIARAPNEAKYRGLRGAARLCKGEYAKGEADLKAAVELNPGDAGADYRPSTDAKLSDAQLKHGRRQVERMLRDRPAMNQYGDEARFLVRWAERKYAGEDFGDPIDWDPTPPLHSDAEHIAPEEDANAAVLIEEKYLQGPQRGEPRSFEELWAGAVFELHNVAFAREFIRLHEEADEGKLSKEQFVGGILRFELLAAQRTRAFYLTQFLPWAAKKKLPTDPTLWFCEWWDSPATVLDSFDDKSEYPWRPYAREYDWATVHRLWHADKFAEALKLLKSMRVEDGYDDELAEVFFWIGHCLEKLDKPADALKAYDRAIKLDPTDPASYRARGQLHKQLGSDAKAAADLARAKELEGEEL